MEDIQLKYCRMLHELSKDLGVARNLPAILNLIVKTAVDTLNIKASSLRLLDEEGKKLDLVAAYGLSDEYLRKGIVEVDKNLIDKEAMDNGRIVEIEDVTKDERLQYKIETIREGIKSIICVPLRVKDRVIGTLRSYTTSKYKFNSTEKTFLLGLSNLGAIAIENARLSDICKKYATNMHKLMELSKNMSQMSLNGNLKCGDVFDRIVKTTTEIFNAKKASISTLEEGRFKPISSCEPGSAFTSKLVIDSYDVPSDLFKERTISIPDIEKSSLPYKDALLSEGIKAMIGAPIIFGGKLVGLLKVYFSENKVFEESEPELLSVLANLGEICIGRSIDRKMIEYMK